MGKGRIGHHRGYNIHHTIWISQKRAKSQEDINKQLVDILDHQALNTIVGTNQHPQAQLEIMNEKFWWDKVMSEYAKELLYLLIWMEREEFYKQSLLIKR